MILCKISTNIYFKRANKDIFKNLSPSSSILKNKLIIIKETPVLF